MTHMCFNDVFQSTPGYEGGKAIPYRWAFKRSFRISKLYRYRPAHGAHGAGRSRVCPRSRSCLWKVLPSPVAAAGCRARAPTRQGSGEFTTTPFNMFLQYSSAAAIFFMNRHNPEVWAVLWVSTVVIHTPMAKSHVGAPSLPD